MDTKKGTTLSAVLQKELENPHFKKAYDELQPEFEIMKALMEARVSCNLTQQELAEKTGINQADISKLENGNGNPSLRTLKRLAAGMGRKLVINFV